ncbi:YceI family protein [Rubrivirga marina]|uniref:Lipid/polyisoprenoid-binding YceI-like domain-containing protein n=1 Tax=Rubrivirga marina TaxID=1196024 RepID=A0A271IXK7_9BACT|nr:YceI family protein [Rubrivirga marina]PAP75932.1 hypothetical protein BSZ37_05500 [Rubrivirga marina]
MTARSSFTALVLVALVGLAGWSALPRYSFTSGSRVWVEGTSTVHDWECEAEQVSAALDAAVSGTAITGISGLTVTTPVAGLECGNGTMNGKLRDALGSAPIRFALTNARVGQPNNGRFLVEATGQLTIHGTTRTQTVRANGRVLSGGRFQFTGEVPVTMSQFGVDPPRAMAGALRTGDRVTVKFDVTAAR